MNRAILYFLCCFIFSCESDKNFEIDSLWVLSIKSSKSNFCEKCNIKDVKCCVFEYKKQLYDRKESYILTNIGGIDSIYSYTIPLGCNVYSRNEMQKVTHTQINWGNSRVDKIYWDCQEKVIVDGNKQYTDYSIDYENRYLVVKTRNGLRLYRYS